MDVSRRKFLFGAGATLAATVVAVPVAEALSVPTLWGDGVHDDTEALQAALDGKPVRIAGESMILTEGRLNGGSYLISAPIVMRRDNFTLAHARLIASKAYKGEHFLTLAGSNLAVSDIVIDGTNLPPSLLAA